MIYIEVNICKCIMHIIKYMLMYIIIYIHLYVFYSKLYVYKFWLFIYQMSVIFSPIKQEKDYSMVSIGEA